MGSTLLIYLDVRDSKGVRYELWVDPKVNFLVRKLICHASLPRGEIRIATEVLSFREVKPGVFFPERLVRSVLLDGNWAEKGEATLTNMRVNEALPAGLFTHTFPVGTRVTDSIRGIAYTVGRDREPTKVGVLVPAPPPATVGTPTPPTAEEVRWPWHRLLLIGSVLTMAVGVCALVWRRRSGAPAA